MFVELHGSSRSGILLTFELESGVGETSLRCVGETSLLCMGETSLRCTGDTSLRCTEDTTLRCTGDTTFGSAGRGKSVFLRATPLS